MPATDARMGRLKLAGLECRPACPPTEPRLEEAPLGVNPIWVSVMYPTNMASRPRGETDWS